MNLLNRSPVQIVSFVARRYAVLWCYLFTFSFIELHIFIDEHLVEKKKFAHFIYVCNFFLFYFLGLHFVKFDYQAILLSTFLMIILFNLEPDVCVF